MKEIEVKILDIDRSEIERKLKSLGASVSFDGEMIATFFDYPDRSVQKKGDLIRLRTEGDVSVLAYKRHISSQGAKIMEESETVIENPAQMKNILKGLGLLPVRENHKHRIQYDLGDTHIVIDRYMGDLAYIPEFIEIEAPGEERMNEVVRLLGFQPEDCVSWNTYDLIRHYKVEV